MKRKVEWNKDWYNNLVSNSNEKKVLVKKIKEIVADKNYSSCLEIGLGTTSQFADELSNLFKSYFIMEREKVNISLPNNVELINADWENVKHPKKYDVIIASHLIYYFKNKQKAIEKILDSLNLGGIAIFVVNGMDADYGKLKLKFSNMINKKYIFAYQELKTILNGKPLQEFSVPSIVRFANTEELFNVLKLSFDLYPKEYVRLKNLMIKYFYKNFKNGEFVINQKIIVCKNDRWEKLINHKDYELNINGIKILVKDKVFTPDPKITYSTSQILNHLPNLTNKEVLDMGCGTGIIGISCLKNGAKRVVFSDNDKNSIENTKINIKINKLGRKSKIVNSNLFEKVSGKFDYIFANLPILNEIWDSNESTENIAFRFLSECKKYIKQNGKVYFSWASFSDINQILKILKNLGYEYKITEETKMNYKWYLIEILF